MEKSKIIYRKNFSLIIVFLVLISVTFIIALIVSYDLNAKTIENDFATKKIDVLEQTVRPYNDLFQNTIPEITFYQGFLDSTSASRYAGSVCHNYPFVKRIVFYDMLIGNPKKSSVKNNNLSVLIKAVYQFNLNKGKLFGVRSDNNIDAADFRQMAVKLRNYIAFSDTSRDQPRMKYSEHFMM